MDAKRFRNSFLLLLVVFISGLFLSMIRQFLMTLLLAAIFSGLMQPAFKQLVGVARGRRSLASAVTLVVFVLVVVVPLLAVLGMVVSEALHISDAVVPWVQEQLADPDALGARLQSLPVVEKLAPYRATIIEKAGQLVGRVSQFLVRGLSAATKGTVAFFFHFFLLIYTMFFFLKDGGLILRRILYYIPMGHEDETRMVDKFISVTRATLKGTLIIGIVQGVLAGAALALAGIDGAVFWGTIMVILSVIPGLGTALVWLPAVIYLIATGQVLVGILVLAWCGGVVGLADNFLRPRLVGKDAKMHELLILFGTLGGIMLFGVVGFIIGPVIAALFVTVWDIYGVVFSDVLPTSSPDDD